MQTETHAETQNIKPGTKNKREREREREKAVPIGYIINLGCELAPNYDELAPNYDFIILLVIIAKHNNDNKGGNNETILSSAIDMHRIFLTSPLN